MHVSNLDSVFYGCTNLEECEIHYIGNTSSTLSSAFSGCTNLKKVTLNLEKTDINVIIETNKKLESLNVSIAGAIMMYELNKK